MSYYRNVYLKSKDWQGLRSAVLLIGKNRCAICKRRDISLDAHHLKYRHLYDARPQELRAVCRNCHNEIHKLIEKYPKLKKLKVEHQWQVIIDHLKRRGLVRKQRVFIEKQIKFGLIRDVLCAMRFVKRRRMKWSKLLATATSNKKWGKPVPFLLHYIKITKTDPRRRLERVGPHHLIGWPQAGQRSIFSKRGKII